ncbi:HAL3-like domain protein [Coemansia reversa NRRL 1564]|uniref:HAL3-like domain protein n=1 Tax=Coemansia reversa (strain ATCC 12441 / NRRL 1564) TaxID=763665 RepID=A0A2G5BEW8_COERN|nr:HAL3-like domain protein [Coemansia reversa NRRL 1564]|eukprot:PIA17560.1 HAL3-like domain protein [Coemansia reversa NRRL 1564]
MADTVESGETAQLTKRVLIGATGSVASIKVPALARSIIQQGLQQNIRIEIAVAASSSALHFFRREQLPEVDVTLYTDRDEWSQWKKIGDPVLHIELRKWADVCVVAPLDANTMAKVANGFCDNLLTCVLRAWDMTKPRIVCPAMNPMMWEHPITTSQITTLENQGFRIVSPISKSLACGDVGMGAMAEPEVIAKEVVSQITGAFPADPN